MSSDAQPAKSVKTGSGATKLATCVKPGSLADFAMQYDEVLSETAEVLTSWHKFHPAAGTPRSQARRQALPESPSPACESSTQQQLQQHHIMKEIRGSHAPELGRDGISIDAFRAPRRDTRCGDTCSCRALAA